MNDGGSSCSDVHAAPPARRADGRSLTLFNEEPLPDDQFLPSLGSKKINRLEVISSSSCLVSPVNLRRNGTQLSSRGAATAKLEVDSSF